MEILMAVWGFFGWKWFVVIPALYGATLVGANSPQTFKRSKEGLENVANKALAKARVLAQKGK